MNNNYYNWGNPALNYGYNKPKLPNPTNPLTNEQMNMLRQKAPQFSLAISEVDALKAICTHRDQNGETLIQNPDGTVTCSICGSTFTPISADPETINNIFKSVIDVLETMKIMYMDIPNEVTTAYFQMIPFLEKGPQMYKIANDHYSRYSSTSVIGRDYNNGNAYNLFAAIMNPMAMGMGMPAQQMPYGQQVMNQQQNVPDVTMGAQNGMNPFDAGSAPAMNSAKTTTDNKQYSL